MANYNEYFNRVGYQARYQIGDRVSGRWNKIPFIGTVGNDTLVSEVEGPRISVHLDLPIRHQDQVRTVIFVKHKDIKKLTVYV